jgi:copper chaperone CopZ
VRTRSSHTTSGFTYPTALAPLPGVRSARVDIEARTVTVDVDEARTNRAQIVAVIEEQGYQVPA